jgi:hypothetical protein
MREVSISDDDAPVEMGEHNGRIVCVVVIVLIVIIAIIVRHPMLLPLPPLSTRQGPPLHRTPLPIAITVVDCCIYHC